ncbi:hypothetical protein, partial [Thiolapillus sp.]|uniref:hypothetical protein n=1 Tax=Thiolapillus sp. TaxID=2017437 RepID=UPI0025F6192F
MFSLWRKARRENSAASRLLGSTSLRFALHGWQRLPRRHRGIFCQSMLPSGAPTVVISKVASFTVGLSRMPMAT